MNFETKVNNKLVTVHLIRKRDIKHCYLKVLDKDNIEIRANYFFNIEDSKNLIIKKTKWLLKHINYLEKNQLTKDEFYFLGVKHKNLDNRNLDIFYKNEAKKIIPPLVKKHENIMNLYSSSLKFRKNKRTWGSCNYNNGLNFNTLLVKFPIEVIEYVIIHELSHIKHKNHSKKFWDLVEKYCPNYKKEEEKLKSFL